MISQTAQGLASLGRNGDSMLVHMSPEEVGGLKQVGDTLGIRMSTNPQTGMPEAFSFGDFFTSFLPTIVGAAVGGPAGGGIMSSMTPILAGAGTGALLAAAKGDDPLMGGLTGGFGGYGGSQLGSAFGKAFGKTGGITAGSVDDIISANIQGAGAPGAMFGGTGQSPLQYNAVGQGGLGFGTTSKLPSISAEGVITPATTGMTSAPLSPTAQAAQNLGDLGTGVKNLTGFNPDMSISDAYKQFTNVGGGTAADLAMPVGGAVLAGLEPSDLGYGTGNLYEDPDKGKYRGSQGQLNLSDRFDTGLRLAMGGTVQSGGIRDLYGTPDNPPTMSSGLGGFGLGRLNNLAGEQAMTQAQTLGYAEGGAVAGGDAVDESAPNPEGVVSKYTTVVDDKGVVSRVRVPYQYEKIITKGAEDFYSIPPIEYAANLYPGSILPKFKKEGFADGGDVGMNIEKQQALNLDRLPSLNVEAGLGIPSGSQYDYFRERPKLYRGLYDMSQSDNPLFSIMGNAIMKNPSNFKFSPQMAKGGYLNGQGDGMSDSIPATIEGKQPARLADGEFVIPADVVSHLGNGSSKAGSKRLYAMLDKVRQARTGNKKQGKEIKAEKYLPA